jgi:hypothetical protein
MARPFVWDHLDPEKRLSPREIEEGPVSGGNVHEDAFTP